MKEDYKPEPGSPAWYLWQASLLGCTREELIASVEYEKGFARGVWHGAVVTCGILALIALVFFSFGAYACEPITFSGNRASIPPNGYAIGVWDTPKINAEHIQLGYTVPPNQYLGITFISFASKGVAWNGTRRSSYLVLRELLTVTEHAPVLSFPKPLLIQPGFLLTGWIYNNSPEHQNMNFIIDGYLSRDPLFRDCK